MCTIFKTLAFFLLIILFASLHASSQPATNSQVLAQTAYKKTLYRLSKPLVAEDDSIYACSENNLFSFRPNGSIAWSVHLDYKCNPDVAPVYGGRGQIYLLAENRILKVNFQKNGTTRSVAEVFFDPGGIIIGFSVSTLSSSVFITVQNRLLYAYNMVGQQLWIAEPKTEHFGYRIGCRKDAGYCFFNSAPVIDQCEASIYISNTEGEVYSLPLRSPHFNWIQDLSTIDTVFSIFPGNNGLLYIVFPLKSLVAALDAFSGDILWQKNVGPFSSSRVAPVVDSNGWISFGSLDGSLYSFAPSGKLKKYPKPGKPDHVIQADPVLDCSGYAIYVARTKMEGMISHIISGNEYVSAKKPVSSLFTLLVPATGYVYWSEDHPDQISILLSEKDMEHFVLDEQIVLAFLAASKTGNPLQCRSKSEKLSSSCSLARPNHVNVYIGNERAITLFLLFESIVLIILVGIVRFCCIFWKKKKIQQGQPLGSFLEKRRSLHLKKKEFDRTIRELQKDAEANETVEKIGDLVRQREKVDRKLSSSYSLGRDRNRASSLLPLHDSKCRSFSFQSPEKESVTIFRTPSEDSWMEIDDDVSTSSDDDADEEEDDQEESSVKGKSMLDEIEGYVEAEDDDDDDDDDGGRDYYRRSPSKPASFVWSEGLVPEPSSSRRRNKLLKRSRTMSSTY